MRNTRLQFFFVVLVTLVVFSSLSFFSTLKEKEALTPRLVPQILALYVANIENRKVTVYANGTGVLIDQERGHVATAKHALAQPEENPGYALYARIDGLFYPLEVVWEHGVADIAIVRFRKEGIPPMLPHAFPVAQKPPAVGESVKLFGYLPQDDRSKLRGCERREPGFVCEKAFLLTVALVNVSAEKISLQMMLDDWEYFAVFRAKHPDKRITFEEFAYTHYIAARLFDEDQEKDFHGMSGGALVNQRGEMVGIVISHYGKDLIFIPALEIPKEYLPHPSH